MGIDAFVAVAATCKIEEVARRWFLCADMSQAVAHDMYESSYV